MPNSSNSLSHLLRRTAQAREAFQARRVATRSPRLRIEVLGEDAFQVLDSLTGKVYAQRSSYAAALQYSLRLEQALHQTPAEATRYAG
ncbi:MAG: hypothetical protein GAK45_00222 [Pseudomonas citronellolis]|nr:MAG: hypothetical protein GAK45_00222 [Pseudomonas citronellolis]